MTKEANRLIEDNIGYARWVAHRWAESQQVLDYDELESLAFLGLTKAAASYDASKNTKFSTYAKIVIENAFKNALKKEKQRTETTVSYIDDMEINSYETDESVLIRQILEDVLTDEEKEIISLAYEHGFSQREIAIKKGVSQTKINSVIRKAKEKIAMELIYE